MAELRNVVPSSNHELPCWMCCLTEGGIQIPLQPVMTNHVALQDPRAIGPPGLENVVQVACSKCRTVKAVLRSELKGGER